MTGACRLLWPPLVVIDASWAAPWALSLVDGAKKMQTSAMKACFQIAECCFSSAKIIHFSAVCSFVEWLVKQNRAKRARNSTLNFWVCANYINIVFVYKSFSLNTKQYLASLSFYTCYGVICVICVICH